MPIPVRMDAPAPALPRQSGIILEPEHLASLTPEQRADLRLWNGRVNLLDRVKLMRWYSLFTLATIPAGIAGFVFGVAEVPPFVLAPAVTAWTLRKFWKRRRSLRESGLKLRQVLLALRARRVIPPPPVSPEQQQMEKLASRETLAAPQGASIRRAVEERAAILEVVANLPKPDRALLPDVEPTVNALVERVAHIAQLLHRLDQGVDPGLVDDLDRRIADAERDRETPDGQRRLALLRRQRATLGELADRRAALSRQLDNAWLALGNLRLDLIKLRSSGLQSALSDVSHATQEARALSRDIGVMLEAAAEVKGL